MVKKLVSESAANSLQLANAIRLGNIAQALELGDSEALLQAVRLINCNEPALKITATLTTTFRTWLTVKQMIITECQDDNTITQLADVKNPKRLVNNFDQADPQFISLKEELERLFKQKKLSEVKQEEMNQNISSLNKIHEEIKELNRQNNLLRAKYDQDVKYVRIHKRLLESEKLAVTERKIYEALRGLKTKADDLILQNTKILNNESYFSQKMIGLLIDQFKNQQKIDINAEISKYINSLIVKEYINEYNRISA